MKKLILLIVLIACLTQAQDITGKWNGILSVEGIELSFVFHISTGDSTYNAKMDSPDEKAFGIQTSAKSFKNSTLNIEIAKEFPIMNYLFQTCKTGAIDEYTTIGQTIYPVVPEEISGWVLKQTK